MHPLLPRNYGGGCLELAAVIICAFALSQPCSAEINVTASLDRITSKELCTHWSSYWDDRCFLCMFSKNRYSRIQPGCQSERMGEAIYAEVNPTISSNNDSVARCDITPLLQPGVRATCTKNTYKYRGMDLPTVHPGALCYFGCASGYKPAGDSITYLECSRCTVKGVFCTWNKTLEGTLCNPDPVLISSTREPVNQNVSGGFFHKNSQSDLVKSATTAGPFVNMKVRNVIIAVCLVGLLFGGIITVLLINYCCQKGRSRAGNEINLSSRHDDELTKQRDPLYTGVNDSIGPEAESGKLKSVDSSEGSESGYSSNTERAPRVGVTSPLGQGEIQPVQNTPNVQNINNFYHHVNIGVTGDVHMVNIDQSAGSSNTKPSSIALELTSQSAVTMDHQVVSGNMELVQVHRSRSKAESINSTPVCDHQLGAGDVDCLLEKSGTSASRKLSIPCPEEVDEPANRDDPGSTIAPLPVIATPKQKAISGVVRVQSSCLTADSGIATANTENLASIEDLSIKLPTSPFSDITQRDDVILLPAENLNSPPTSIEENGLDVSSFHVLVSECRCPEVNSSRDSTSDPSQNIQETSKEGLGQSVKQDLWMNAIGQQQAATSLELNIPSMDSISVRQLPAGNSDDLPAPDAGPCSLMLEDPPASDDSLMFSTLNSSSIDTGPTNTMQEASYHRLTQLDNGKEAFLESHMELVGPASEQEGIPSPLTENPPHPNTPEAEHYPYPIWQASYDPRQQYLPQNQFYYRIDPRADAGHRYSAPPPYDPSTGNYFPQSPRNMGNMRQPLHVQRTYLPRQQGPFIHDQNVAQHPPYQHHPPHQQHPPYQQPPPHQQHLHHQHHPLRQQHPMHEDPQQIRHTAPGRPRNVQQEPQGAPTQQSPRQEYAPIPSGELVLKAKHVGEFVMKKERIIRDCNNEHAHSLIRQTSMYPQSGAVRVEADTIDKVCTTTTDKIHAKECAPDETSQSVCG
ncbi:uncharacterized protein [Watersipora subatra]|uniref:uncharacterized protein n=1 Tax=Watersipora subatra TaxID=2589382 RepID=UPI00355C5BBC